MTEGDYGTEVDLRRSNDEIGLLAESFNEMSRKMAADIEQLQKLNDQLIRTEKLVAMGTLAAGVAHEVNNPLAAISSLIQMIQAQESLDEETKEMLRLVSTQINRIKQVTRDMMDFARFSPAAKRAVNINEVLESGLRLATFDTSFRSLKIIKNFQQNLPEINADHDQLQQVFLNLFLNSRDAMPNGGELKVKTRQILNELKIEITDNGTGINEKDLKKVFDPFFTTKITGKGTGLGLAVCYGIITAHEGKIEVKSDAETGTSFLIYLPVSKEMI